MDKRMVLFERFGIYYLTTYENYYSPISNARIIYKMNEFETVEDMIKYCINNFGSYPYIICE